MRGLDLCRRFYAEAVRPILQRRFPRVEHAAALLGPGSEVLGYDDATSTDHHWGPRVQLFLADLAPAAEIERALAHELPATFGGFPTNFGPPDEIGVRVLVPVESGPVAHRVECLDLGGFLCDRLGVDPRAGCSVVDWLVTPSQRLLEVTAGDVFHDSVGELTRVRERLAFYPHDVWLLVMAGHWHRIGELEHLHGRAGMRGDELGRRVLAAALANDVMRLALLQARRYPPYPKWLGTAYAELDRPEGPALAAALAAGDARGAGDRLAEAYRELARSHNALRVTEPLDPEPRQFHGRPFRVLFADRFGEALRAAIEAPDVRAVDHRAGAVDAVSDSTEILTRARLWRRLAALYDPPATDVGERESHGM